MKYGSNIKIDLKIDVHISDQFAKSNNQKHLNCLNMKHLLELPISPWKQVRKLYQIAQMLYIRIQ